MAGGSGAPDGWCRTAQTKMAECGWVLRARMINIVEMIAGESHDSPCKFGNIVDGHACYCHHESPDAPRKCPIWRSCGESDMTKWRREPWLPDEYHLRRVTYRKRGDKQLQILISEKGKTWPDEGCPLFEPNPTPHP